MHAVLLAVRLLAGVVAMLGVILLGREQATTVSRGLPARPARIVAYVGVVLLGLAIGVVAMTAAV